MANLDLKQFFATDSNRFVVVKTAELFSAVKKGEITRKEFQTIIGMIERAGHDNLVLARSYI